MSREDILLKEYELSQRNVDSLTSRYWIVAGTFIAITTALLGGMAYSIAFQGLPSEKGVNWVALVLGVAISAGMIFILLCLLCYVKRIDFNILVNYDRIREIESELGMWQGWRIHALDEWHDTCNGTPKQWKNVPISMTEKLLSYRPKEWWESWRGKYVPPRGTKSVRLIFRTLIALWMVMCLLFLAPILVPIAQNFFNLIIKP